MKYTTIEVFFSSRIPGRIINIPGNIDYQQCCGCRSVTISSKRLTDHLPPLRNAWALDVALSHWLLGVCVVYPVAYLRQLRCLNQKSADLHISSVEIIAYLRTVTSAGLVEEARRLGQQKFPLGLHYAADSAGPAMRAQLTRCKRNSD